MIIKMVMMMQPLLTRLSDCCVSVIMTWNGRVLQTNEHCTVEHCTFLGILKGIYIRYCALSL